MFGKRKAMIAGLAVLALLFAIQLLMFLALQRSDAFAKAESAVRSDVGIAGKYGTVRSVRMTLFGSDYTVAGRDGAASFDLKVTGDRGEGDVTVDLEMSEDVWSVSRVQAR